MRAFLERLGPFAPLALRLAVAALCCAYGGKLVFRDMAALHAAVAGWALPKWMAAAAAWTLLVGGALLGIGFLGRLAALAVGACVTLLLVKTRLHGWQGIDLATLSLLFAACLSLVLSGAGRLSLDRRLFGGAD